MCIDDETYELGCDCCPPDGVEFWGAIATILSVYVAVAYVIYKLVVR